MRSKLLCGLFTITLLIPATVSAQRGNRRTDAEFLTTKPLVGEALPDLVAYDVRGNRVTNADLRGHYTVLTFGCLT